MIKKVLIIGAGVLLVGVLALGTGVSSYVRTSAGYVKDSVRDSVPIEFEIKRARHMINNLMPEVRKNMHVIAKEEVEVKRLEEQIQRAEEGLAKEKSQMMRLKSDLATGQDVFRYAGRDYSADQVKIDLANRFDRYKTGDATLASLRQIHDARQRSLEAARQKLEGMLAARRKLQVDVENLEARLQMIAAAKATSEYQFDDSQLGRVKELISDLRRRLDVADNLVKAESHYYDEIPLDKTAPEDIVDQVTEYFSEEKPSVEEIAAQ